MRNVGLARLRYIEGISAGVFVAAFGATVATYWSLPDERELFDLSTLISATIAILAAFLTIRAILAQLENQLEIEEERRKRKERAAKAGLALALSDLYHHSDCAIDWYLYTHKDRKKAEKFSQLIQAILSAIEFADEQTANFLSQLIHQLQVAEARTQSHQRKVASLGSYEQVFIFSESIFLSTAVRWSIVKIACSRALSYARGSKNSLRDIPITREDVEEAVRDAIININGTISLGPERKDAIEKHILSWFKNGPLGFLGLI